MKDVMSLGQVGISGQTLTMQSIGPLSLSVSQLSFCRMCPILMAEPLHFSGSDWLVYADLVPKEMISLLPEPSRGRGRLRGWLRAATRIPFMLMLFNCEVVSDSLRPHGLQQARLPCPPLSLGDCSNSCPLSQWCHPTISSSVALFSSCPQSFPALRSFLVSQVFTSGGQKYWSFSFSISPSNEYSGLISFRIDWFDLLAAQGTLKNLLQHHTSKASIL